MYKVGDTVLVWENAADSMITCRFLCRIDKVERYNSNYKAYVHKVLYNFSRLNSYYDSGDVKSFTEDSNIYNNSRKLNTNDINRTIKVIKVLFNDV